MNLDTLLQSLFNSNLLYLLGAGILLAIVSLIKKVLENESHRISWDLITNLFKKKSHVLDNQTQNIITKINEDLVILLERMKSDRAYIFEFHNGSVYASQFPQWKLSQTYEKVKPGTSKEGKNLQDLPASLIWDDFLKPLFTGVHTDALGCTFINNTKSCTLGCSSNRSVYYFTVENMQISQIKTTFEIQGIFSLLISPIITYQNQIIGFVGVDYCEDIDVENDLDIRPCDLCKFSSQLSLIWTKGEKDRQKMMEHQKKLYS